MNTRLSVFGLGTAIGIVLGLGLLLAGWLSIFGLGTHFVNVLSSLFPLYTPTFAGSIFGAVWGFICGFIHGSLIALFYNLICFGRS